MRINHVMVEESGQRGLSPCLLARWAGMLGSAGAGTIAARSGHPPLEGNGIFSVAKRAGRKPRLILNQPEIQNSKRTKLNQIQT
jgi:hypothetical protein